MKILRLSALFFILLVAVTLSCRESEIIVPEVSAATRDVFIVPDLLCLLHQPLGCRQSVPGLHWREQIYPEVSDVLRWRQSQEGGIR